MRMLKPTGKGRREGQWQQKRRSHHGDLRTQKTNQLRRSRRMNQFPHLRTKKVPAKEEPQVEEEDEDDDWEKKLEEEAEESKPKDAVVADEEDESEDEKGSSDSDSDSSSSSDVELRSPVICIMGSPA